MQSTEVGNTRKAWLVIPLCCLALSMSGCAFLPNENETRAVSVVVPDTQYTYKEAICTRGDLHLTEKITCNYLAARACDLSFRDTGKIIEEVYVSAGDTVKTGDILAALDSDSIEETIEDERLQLERLTIEERHNDQDEALAQKRDAITGGSEAEEFVKHREELQDKRLLLETALERDLEKQNRTLLIAPMDGTVTYVKALDKNARSVSGEKLITVSDISLLVFRAKTEYWDAFTEGEAFTVSTLDNSYAATVVSEAELGLEETEHVAGKSGYVYFLLNDPAFDLESGDRGTVELELDRRENVLTIDEKAVSVINGETVVYYQNADGVRAFKTVRVGLYAQKKVEIIEGLEEGEHVIIGS